MADYTNAVVQEDGSIHDKHDGFDVKWFYTTASIVNIRDSETGKIRHGGDQAGIEYRVDKVIQSPEGNRTSLKSFLLEASFEDIKKVAVAKNLDVERMRIEGIKLFEGLAELDIERRSKVSTDSTEESA